MKIYRYTPAHWTRTPAREYLPIPCASRSLVWLFGLFNNLNKYGCECGNVRIRSFIPFVCSLCVNALWISIDFSSAATTESISFSFPLFGMNGCIHVDSSRLCVYVVCVCGMRNRAPYGSTCQRSIKICLLVMDFGMTLCRFSSDFRFIPTIALYRLMKWFFSSFLSSSSFSFL